MRSNLGIRAALLATIALGVPMLGSTAAMGHGKSHALRLVATPIQSEFVDVGAPGPSLGDELIRSQTLADRGREVGESGLVCTVVQVTPPYGVLTAQCLITLSLRRGQITLQGLIEAQSVDDPGPFTLAITGGTGAYRGASGEAQLRRRIDTTSIYKLRLDADKKKKHRH